MSREYILSFGAFGSPIELSTAGGWLLKRQIGTSGMSDAMGSYPLFCCKNWSGLANDLAELRDSIVSVVVVTDPLADVNKALLETSFEKVRLYKHHFVIDTRMPMMEHIRKSHRQLAMRALRQVKIERCAHPLDYADDWERLFAVLAQRHAISGMRRFSREAFRRQLATPGMVMFRAAADGNTVGLDLWYVQKDVAHGHLAAFDETGYRLRASYAAKWKVIEYFADKVRWINLGAGKLADATDGLSAFKRGFATGTKPAWLCGSILCPQEYENLCRQGGNRTAGDYFPTYRFGEFD